MPNPFPALRFFGRLEAVSFLILLGVAMPLKYLAGQPTAVQIVGWLHGLLFIAYGIAVARAWRAASWGKMRPTVLMIAALLPFGPVIVERRFGIWEQEWRHLRGH